MEQDPFSSRARAYVRERVRGCAPARVGARAYARAYASGCVCVCAGAYARARVYAYGRAYVYAHGWARVGALARVCACGCDLELIPAVRIAVRGHRIAVTRFYGGGVCHRSG